MKEILTIPIEFDTSAIESRLETDGYEMVIESITKAVMTSILKCLPGEPRGYYSGNSAPRSFDEVNWSKFVGQRLDLWMQEHAEEVVDEAAILLAQKGARKRKWRDLVHELKEQEADNG